MTLTVLAPKSVENQKMIKLNYKDFSIFIIMETLLRLQLLIYN